MLESTYILCARCCVCISKRGILIDNAACHDECSFDAVCFRKSGELVDG